MKLAHKSLAIVLVVLLVATVYGVFHTGRESRTPAGNRSAATTGSDQAVQVDQTPLLTAQALARMPTSAVELPSAQGALQLADQEMDLAFALAVLDATQHPPKLTPEAKEIQAQLQMAEDALAAQQAQVTQITAADARASGAQKDSLDDQLDLANAQLDLRQDEVDDAKQDLIRAGGDPQDRIQTMVQQHQAASQASDATKVAAGTANEPQGLIQRFEQWSTLHQKQLRLWEAKQEAESAAAAFVTQHNSLGQEIAQSQKSRPTVAPGAKASKPVSAGKSGNPSREQSAAILQRTKERAADRRTLTSLDKRIENEKQLADVYGQWIAVVATEQRSLVNGGLRDAGIILAIVLIGLFVDDWIGRLIGKVSMDRRQGETLRTVTRVTLQVVGVLLILLVIFGPPNQLGTFLGLAGAGLTVALKDFIIGFLGWFVLMGKNGIRLGDWVEINGVAGEVVELGMFHTVLLETGNWTTSGHPTGRRVTFTNSFAIEGHYFNFSTSGQWMWDELQIVLPAGQNPYPIVAAIQKTVVEATAESARQAEEEWRGAAKTHDMSGLSAAPAIDVRPVAGGTEIAVRYIARANERSALRAKLNHAAVDLLGVGIVPQPESDPPKAALASK